MTVHRSIVFGIISNLTGHNALGLDFGDLVEINVGLIVTPGSIEQVTDLGHRTIPENWSDLVDIDGDWDS